MSTGTHHLFWLVWLWRNRIYFNTQICRLHEYKLALKFTWNGCWNICENSGVSFTGDGIRYHILQYDEESADIILKSFDWEAGELDSELADKMEEWLDSIDVPLEDRPKQNEWKHTTLLRKEYNRDHLIMFFDEDTNQLYVVEYFL